MDALKLSPCRYAGSFSEENLVIAAHNYSSSFGEISRLSAGDTVTLVDGLGDRHSYQVEHNPTLHFPALAAQREKVLHHSAPLQFPASPPPPDTGRIPVHLSCRRLDPLSQSKHLPE